MPYSLLGSLAAATFGFWWGWAQWLVLRRSLPISSRWIFVVGLSVIAPIFLVAPLFIDARWGDRGNGMVGADD